MRQYLKLAITELKKLIVILLMLIFLHYVMMQQDMGNNISQLFEYLTLIYALKYQEIQTNYFDPLKPKILFAIDEILLKNLDQI